MGSTVSVELEGAWSFAEDRRAAMTQGLATELWGPRDTVIIWMSHVPCRFPIQLVVPDVSPTHVASPVLIWNQP